MISLILKLMENEALKTAFLKLANMSISASWLLLAILVLRLVLKKAPKWVSVLLWGIVAIRLICPFLIESALSLIPSTLTIPMNIEMAAKPAIDSGVPVVNSVVNPMIAASFTPNPAASANPLQIWIPLAAVIWAFGMVLMLLYTAISYGRLNRRIHTAVLYRDNIFQSENVSSPFVLGIIIPKIYLPFHMYEQDLQHVVAHEQAHICRKDHWWKPLGFLLLTIHWFNPLMWLAYILLCRDIELACDEKVIKELNSEQRANYTQALVACSMNRRLIAACPLAFGEVSVKDRVKSIMNYRKPSFWLTMTALVACGIASICFLTNPISNESNTYFLNYRNAISLSDCQDVIPAVHYSSENKQGRIGIGMVEGDAFAKFLDNVDWTEKWMEPSDRSSPGSVAVNVADNLRITVYDRNFATVEFNDGVCYYRTGKEDYKELLGLLIPADEERLEMSAESRLDLVLGVATIKETEAYLIDYTINQVMPRLKNTDVRILSITDDCALVYTLGESPELLVYHYTFDNINGSINITGIVRGNTDSSAEISINHFRMDDQHVYFGKIKMNHGQPEENVFRSAERLSVKFIGEAGETFETSWQDNSFYLTTLESPLENFELLNSEKQVLWDLERYFDHGYVIQESSLLIAALGTNGTRGYVKAEDLDGDIPSNPKEAVAYMAEIERKTAYGTKKYVRMIPLYAADGVTVIGEFAVG